MIDWHEVARHAPIARLGEILRRQLNVWVDFIGAAGVAVPIGASQRVDKPLCEAFSGRRDPGGSCLMSVRRWLESLRAGEVPPDGPQRLSCHAHLNAIVVPIVMDAEVIGGVFASGFLPGGDVQETEQAIFHRGKQLELTAAVVAHGTRELVRIDEREVRLVAELLQAIVDIAIDVLGGEDTPERPRRKRRGPRDYRHIIGASAAMGKLFKLLDKVCESESTVLVTGEGGVGKELVARAIHYNSFRANEAFVVQNCSALNDSLLDSELFGHKRGAFTGAISDKQGLFELADRGTFFLDEIGDMTPVLQVKLLRVLQEGTFVPVGDTVTRKVDVRIIAATNRDLRQLVKDGAFRSDLYYRLNVITVPVPALRERPEDIPPLLDHFLEVKAAENGQPLRPLSKAGLELMLAHDWPGNVRELENEVERLVVLCDDVPEIPAELLSPRIQRSTGRATPIASAPAGGGPQLPDTLPDALEVLERHMILESLRRSNWNKTRTAKELGISRRNLIRKVDRYRLDDLRPEDA